MRAQVLLPDGSIRLEPGSHTVRHLSIRNIGLLADRFTFEVIGAAASWTRLDPPAIALGPDATGQVALHFDPPRAAHVRAGQMPFGLLTTSAQGAASSVVERLLEVGPFVETAMELVPCEIRRRSGTFRLLVSNRGNVTVRISLLGRDQSDLLRVDCLPARLTVFPGAVAQSHIMVRCTTLRWRGRPSVLPFRVIMHYEDATATPGFVAGELPHYPMLSSWPMLSNWPFLPRRPR